MREQAAKRVETAQEGAAEMREETAESATARVEANTEAEMSAEERALAAQQRVEQMKAGEEVSTSAAAATRHITVLSLAISALDCRKLLGTLPPGVRCSMQACRCDRF